jgi:copper chaperone CopZ
MDINRIKFRVAGMVQHGGFVWSGCPDAVRAAVTALRGVVEVAYDAQEDLFTVRFDTQQAGVEDIFTAVYVAGRQAGQDYLPQMVSWRPPPKNATFYGSGVIKAPPLMRLNLSAAAPRRWWSAIGLLTPANGKSPLEWPFSQHDPWGHRLGHPFGPYSTGKKALFPWIRPTRSPPKKSVFPWYPSWQAFSPWRQVPAFRVFCNTPHKKIIFSKTLFPWGVIPIFYWGNG